jgi:hypothetical protein
MKKLYLLLLLALVIGHFTWRALRKHDESPRFDRFPAVLDDEGEKSKAHVLPLRKIQSLERESSKVEQRYLRAYPQDLQKRLELKALHEDAEFLSLGFFLDGIEVLPFEIRIQKSEADWKSIDEHVLPTSAPVPTPFVKRSDEEIHKRVQQTLGVGSDAYKLGSKRAVWRWTEEGKLQATYEFKIDYWQGPKRKSEVWMLDASNLSVTAKLDRMKR